MQNGVLLSSFRLANRYKSHWKIYLYENSSEKSCT